VGQCRAAITRAVEAAAESLCIGGRLIYIGAGTSGRIGVLDASECPPTFGVSPDVVVGIMAGGDTALRTGIEGAEDDREQAVRDLEAQAPDLGERDTIVGIAASGSTPYTRAALDHARACGATTVLLSCNPVFPVAADIVIEALTGPEALPGSTRLKAGTATKVILNTISTGAMALSGRVYDGYMVCVQPTNDKLRVRAVGIVTAITGDTPEVCEARLRDADWHVLTAIVMTEKGLDAQAAAALLAKHNDHLRQALDEA
jgi:N-acetylmuramic acid 6-phosphate etherase